MPMLESSLQSAADSGVELGSTDDLTGAFDTAAYVLIALGAFSVVVGLFGCAGACCSVVVMLAVVSPIVKINILWNERTNK